MKKSSSLNKLFDTRFPLPLVLTSNENKCEVRFGLVKLKAVKTISGWLKRATQNLRNCYGSAVHTGRVAEKSVTEIWEE